MNMSKAPNSSKKEYYQIWKLYIWNFSRVIEQKKKNWKKEEKRTWWWKAHRRIPWLFI